MVPETKPDEATCLEHLRHITRRWDELHSPALLELRFLSAEDSATVKDVRRYQPTDQGLADAAAHAAAMNSHNLNAYCVINPINAMAEIHTGKAAKDTDILGSFYQWADADDAQAAQNIRSFVGPRPTYYVLTGTQPCARPHVYWELEEPTLNLQAWTETQRAIASTLKTDPAVINPSRIMRLAGTVNWPKPKKQAKGYIAERTTITVYDEDKRPRPSSEQMRRAFVGNAQAAPSGLQIDTGPAPRSATEYADILRRARTDGEKHTGVRDLSASLAGAGVNRALAEAIIREACPVWDDNAENLLNSAYAKFYSPAGYAVPDFDAPAEKNTPQAPAIEWFKDIQPALTDAYIVKGVVAQEAMSVVYGPSNSGKTFFALDLAYHIAIGAQWRGRRVRQAAVLYLAAEGGRGIANRIVALRRETGVEDAPFALRRAGMDLLKDQADLKAVYDLAQHVKSQAEGLPLFIVIDTLSRVMAGGDENSAQDMTALIRNIDAIREATNAHIMLVHHTGKDTAKGARGHSSLRAATDTEIEVQSEDGERAAQVTKQRDYQGGETFAFALKGVPLGVDQDGDEVKSCIVEATDSDEFKAAKQAKKSRGKNQKLIMDTFDQMLAEGMGKPNPGGVGMPEIGTFWCVETDELRTLSMGKMTGDRKSEVFKQSWDALTARDGLFCAAHKLCWRIDRKKR